MRKLVVSLAAEATIADYGGQAGWESDSWLAEVISPVLWLHWLHEAKAGYPVRDSALCSLREGVISEGTETFWVNNSFHGFFMV